MSNRSQRRQYAHPHEGTHGHDHDHTHDLPARSLQAPTPAQIADAFDVEDAYRNAVAALDATTVLESLRDNVPPEAMTAFLRSQGQRQLTRALASQLLAKMRKGNGPRDETVHFLCAPQLAVFSYPFTYEQWQALTGDDDRAAAGVMLDKPSQIAWLQDEIKDLHDPVRRLGLVAATQTGCDGAVFALGLLALTDPSAAIAYGTVRDQHPELPADLDLLRVRPVDRLRRLGVELEREDLEDFLTDGLAAILDGEPLEEVPPPAYLGVDLDVMPNDVLIEQGWDMAHRTATMMADDLQAGRLPSRAASRWLSLFADRISALGQSLDATDRQELQAVLAELAFGGVDSARRWLLRLAELAGPDSIEDEIAALASLAEEAAAVDVHERDEALAALLRIVDLTAERAAGRHVDVMTLLTAAGTANAGLPEHQLVVNAANAGLLTAPPADTDTEGATDATAVEGLAEEATPATRQGDEPVGLHDELAELAIPIADNPEPGATLVDLPDPTDQTPGTSTTPETVLDDAPTDQRPTEAATFPEPDEIVTASPDDHADGDAAAPDVATDDPAAPSSDPTPGSAAVELFTLTALPPALARLLHPTPAQAAQTDTKTTPDVEPEEQPGDERQRPADEPAGTEQLDADLLTSGRFALAGDLAEAGELGRAPAAARRLAAYAQHLTSSTGTLATAFSQAAAGLSREDLAGDRTGQLTAWAAACKAAVLAPTAGPADMLVKLSPCIESSPALLATTNALVESARAGVVVVAPEALAAVGAHDKLHQHLDELSDAAQEVVTRTRSFKYAPAGELFKAWIAPEGPLGPLLRAVREQDLTAVPMIRDSLLGDMRGDAEKAISHEFVAMKGNRHARIVGQPRTQLIERWHAVLDLAEDFVTTSTTLDALKQADHTTWQATALGRLRSQIGDQGAALEDLDQLATGAGLGPDSAVVQLLADTFAACNGQVPLGVEPPLAFVEHRELLDTGLPLDATTLTADGAATVAELLDVATSPAAALAATYEHLAARGAHDLTGILVEAARALNGPVAAALDSRRARDMRAMDQQVRAELASARDDVTLRRVTGTLDEDTWSDAVARLDALDEPGRRDYERIRAALGALGGDLERAKTRQIETVLAQIDADSENPTVAAAATHLAELARAGLVSSAEEELQQARDGVPHVTSVDRVSHLRTFFPAVPLALRQTQVVETLQRALRDNQHNDVTTTLADAGVDLLALSDARREQARTVLTAWRELSARQASTTGSTEVDKLKLILRQAGLEFTDHTREKGGTRDQATLTLSGLTQAGRALSPSLGTERSPDGTLRVLLVRNAATPATVIETLAGQPKDRTVLVLWLTGSPLSPAEWRSIAETARGRASYPPVVFLDLAALVYLASRPEPRLSTFASIALPFAAANPYRDVAGDTAIEMFYGRTEERGRLLDMTGSSFVSGGRGLGKSALLRRVQREFTASAGHHAVVVSIYNVGKNNDPQSVWAMLWPALADLNIVTGPVPATGAAAATYGAIRTWIGQDPGRQLLLMLDEADDFLDADSAGARFENVEWFRKLMFETGRAVKVVLAGLHRTARFGGLPNQPLTHLGAPVVVGPLRPQHARALLTEPLAAIGYQFDSELTLARVLAEANNMPAQLQIVGKSLVEHMSAKALGEDNPPTLITTDDVDAVFTAKLRSDLTEKFTLTLTLDPRYQVIANIVAQAAYIEGPAATVTLPVLAAECRTTWPAGFANLSTDAFRGLVNECVDLGVLVRDQASYRLRTAAVRRALGTEEAVYEFLEQAPTTLTVPKPYDGSAFRRQVHRLDDAISPLTERQLGAILAERRGVVLVAGSPATGLDKVVATLEEVAPTQAPVTCRTVTGRPESITAATELAAGRTVLIVDARTANARVLRALVDAAEDGTAASSQEVTVVLVAGPASAGTWVEYPNRVELEPIDVNGLRLLVGADVLPFQHQTTQQEVTAATGGWLDLYGVIVDQYRSDGPRDTAALLGAVTQRLSSHRGSLASSVGMTTRTGDPLLAPAFLQVADLTSTTPEDAVTLAELLDAVDEPAYLAAKAASAFSSSEDVVAALVAVAALRADDSGHLAADQVLLADVNATR